MKKHKDSTTRHIRQGSLHFYTGSPIKTIVQQQGWVNEPIIAEQSITGYSEGKKDGSTHDNTSSVDSTGISDEQDIVDEVLISSSSSSTDASSHETASSPRGTESSVKTGEDTESLEEDEDLQMSCVDYMPLMLNSGNLEKRKDLRHIKEAIVLKRLKRKLAHINIGRSVDGRKMKKHKDSTTRHIRQGSLHFYTGSPIKTIVQQQGWVNEPIIAEQSITGKYIYTFTSPKVKIGYGNVSDEQQPLLKKWKWRAIPFRERIPLCFYFLFNKATAITALNFLLCSAFLAIASLYYTTWEIYYTVVYSVLTLTAEILILEPLILLLISILTVWRQDTTVNLAWARRRVQDTTRVTLKQHQYQDAGYIHRLEYSPSWQYKSLGKFWHQYILEVLNIVRKKKLAQEKRFKSNQTFLIMLLCAIVIMNVHSSVNECYVQKKMIYQVLTLNDHIEKPVVVVDEIWTFLLGTYIPFTTSRDSMQAAPHHLNVFTKIRQLRVRPELSECAVLPVYRESNVSVVCMAHLTHSNQDTQSYTFDWKGLVVAPSNKNNNNNNDSSASTPHSGVPPLKAAYHFTPQGGSSILEYLGTSFPHGGYQYTFRKDSVDNTETISRLSKSKWLDQHTRVLLIESSAFDHSTGVASAITITYLFKPDGIEIKYWCQSVAFLFTQARMVMLISAIGVLSCITFIDSMALFSMISTIGLKGYLTDKMRLFSAAVILLNVLVLAGLFFRHRLSEEKYAALQKTMFGTDGPLYITLTDLALVVTWVNNISGLMSFGVLMLILQSARHVERLHIMIKLVKHVFFLAIPPALCVLILSMSIYLLFYSNLYEWSSMQKAMYTTFQYVISPSKVRLPSNSIGMTFDILMWVVFFVVITNGFLVTLNEDYSVLVTQARQRGKASMLQAMLDILRNMGGIIKDEDLKADTSQDIDQESSKLLTSLSNGW